MNRLPFISTVLLAQSACSPACSDRQLEAPASAPEVRAAKTNDWSGPTEEELRAEDRKLTDTRIDAIQMEIAELGEHDWAGSYFGFNVAIFAAPKAGVVFQKRGCKGAYDWHRGQIVEVSPAELKLRMETQPRASEIEYMSPRLIRVAWGSERLLIPDTKILDFCNAVNAGGTYRNFPTRAHRGVPNLPSWLEHPSHPEGLPVVPAEWRKFILEKPVVANVVEILHVERGNGPLPDVTVNAILDCGTNQGVLVGMTLHLTKQRFFGGHFTITSVAADTCWATFLGSMMMNKEDVPVAGDNVSTQSWIAEIVNHLESEPVGSPGDRQKK